MNDHKKNIDRLFQEKFKDFDPVPEKELWDGIASRLDEKEKERRIIPIWWRLGGIAAVLAVLFYITSTSDFSNSSIPNNNDTPLTNTEKSPTKDNNSNKTRSSTPNNPTINFEKNTNNAVAIEENQVPKKEKTNKKDQNNAITDNNTKTNNNPANLNRKKEVVLNNNNPKKNNALALNTSKNTVLETEDKKQKTESNTHSTRVSASDSNNTTNASLSQEKEEAIAENKTPDSQKKSLLDAIKEIEEEELVENIELKKSKWTLIPNIAPVYYSGFGEGSPISAEFSENSKSGNVNLSYGINIAYNISEKISIRSGINNVNFGYNTNDILFTTSKDNINDISSINYESQAENIIVYTKENAIAAANDQLIDKRKELADTAARTPILEGDIIQEFSYLEVPLEVSYSVINKKLGLHVIGGLSTLFLTKNSVLLESQDLVTKMGESNTVNSLNFSTNIGIGLDYKISKKILINLEPMFKYQLNTFSDTNGSFNPYSLGVHTGIKFKF